MSQEHARTIRPCSAAVQRAGACVCRKSLRWQGRAFLWRDLPRHRPGRNGSRMLVRAEARVVACPAPHIPRVSPNGWRLRERDSDGVGADLLHHS